MGYHLMPGILVPLALDSLLHICWNQFLDQGLVFDWEHSIDLKASGNGMDYEQLVSSMAVKNQSLLEKHEKFKQLI